MDELHRSTQVGLMGRGCRGRTACLERTLEFVQQIGAVVKLLQGGGGAQVLHAARGVVYRDRSMSGTEVGGSGAMQRAAAQTIRAAVDADEVGQFVFGRTEFRGGDV